MRSDAWKDGEKELVPKTLAEAVELHGQIIDAGHRPDVASGAVMWLIEKAHGRDSITGPTRSRYRKVLAEICEHGHSPRGNGKRSRRSPKPPIMYRPSITSSRAA